jgi:hypothetical protein
MRAAGTILGLLLLAVVLSDAFEVMLLPRRVRRKMRLVTYLLRSTWFVWSSAATYLRPGPRRNLPQPVRPVISINANRRVGSGFNHGLWDYLLGRESRPRPRSVEPSLF